MSPIDLLYRLKKYYVGDHKKDLPVITTTDAAALSILFTLIYVLPFYLSASTRPSPTLNRDAPSVIRARIQAVTVACFIASGTTLYFLLSLAKAQPLEAIKILGWYPINLTSIFKSCLLVTILFTGPLFEKFLIENSLANIGQLRTQITSSLCSWIGYRNYIAGPVTEEVMFRSVLIPLHLLAKISPTKIVFLTPLYFGIAHIHHFYEFHLTHPDFPLVPAALRSLFQFAYTTLFGWFASFVYLRTGSIYACIIIHAFCNWAGLPRFWGRVQRGGSNGHTPVILRGKDDKEAKSNRERRASHMDLGWTVLYYLLLVAGAYGFILGFWPLTESSEALASFSSSKTK